MTYLADTHTHEWLRYLAATYGSENVWLTPEGIAYRTANHNAQYVDQQGDLMDNVLTIKTGGDITPKRSGK